MKFPEFSPAQQGFVPNFVEIQKGADRCIYPYAALDSLNTINANDPRPNTGNRTAQQRLLRYLTVSRNDKAVCRNTPK